MRIISGLAKGLKLSPPPGGGQIIRPTSDRSREALFSIIHNRIPGALVLDLYAGTGALGLEAMSRGAKGVTFIDKRPLAIKLIKKNINNFLKTFSSESISTAQPFANDKAGFPTPIKVFQRDLRRGLSFLKQNSIEKSPPYDLIFFDPPYSKGLSRQTLLHLDKGGFLSEYGLLIGEEHTKEQLPEELSTLHLVDKRQYGDTTFWLYERK